MAIGALLHENKNPSNKMLPPVSIEHILKMKIVKNLSIVHIHNATQQGYAA